MKFMIILIAMALNVSSASAASTRDMETQTEDVKKPVDEAMAIVTEIFGERLFYSSATLIRGNLTIDNPKFSRYENNLTRIMADYAEGFCRSLGMTLVKVKGVDGNPYNLQRSQTLLEFEPDGNSFHFQEIEYKNNSRPIKVIDTITCKLLN